MQGYPKLTYAEVRTALGEAKGDDHKEKRRLECYNGGGASGWSYT